MSSKNSIVALAPNSWAGPWTGRQQLLSRLGVRGWTVLYSTGALSVYDRGSNAWNNAPLFRRTGTSDSIHIDRAGIVLPRWPRFRPFDKAAVRLHASGLLRSARELGAGNRVLLFLFHPRYAAYARALPELDLAYHAFDTYAGLPGWNEQLARDEAEIVERARVIFASSAGIGANLPGSGPRRFVLLENGADAEAFSEGRGASCPTDLKLIPRPRVGYVGRITAKLDFQMMADVAAARSDWQWVFVGPIVLPADSRIEMGRIAHAGIERLRRMPNVHFLGEKHPMTLPAYAAHMDVNTLCYRSSGGWWVDCYPLKLHEYLAAGPPVVSSPLAVVRQFAAEVALAADREEWLTEIERSITSGGSGTAESRLRVAKMNSWDRRVDVLEDELLQLMNHGNILERE